GLKSVLRSTTWVGSCNRVAVELSLLCVAVETWPLSIAIKLSPSASRLNSRHLCVAVELSLLSHSILRGFAALRPCVRVPFPPAALRPCVCVPFPPVSLRPCVGVLQCGFSNRLPDKMSFALHELQKSSE